jgi:hypothetical protein
VRLPLPWGAMRILCALLFCVALAGCGGGNDEPAATATATVDEEGQVRRVFNDYNAALAAQDWRKSCSYLAPETAAKLRENVRKLGYTAVPKDCPRLLAATYRAVESRPDQQHVIETVLKTAKVDGINVTGDSAVIDWHADFNGTQQPVEQKARKIDGEWKLIDVTS